MPSIRVSYDEDAVERNVSRILNRKLEKMTSLDTKMEIAGVYGVAIAKYVPYKTGKLLNSADVVADGNNAVIRYSAHSKRGYDYAQKQYETPYPQESRSTPGTYDHWNRHLTSAEREEFYEDAAKIIARESNNG